MRVEFTLAGGLLDPDGTCHREGELRPLTGYDEEWIHALPPSTSRPAFATELLRRCVKRIGEHRVTRAIVRRLTIGDRDLLVLKIYQATFGDVLSLIPICPRAECGARMDLDLRLADIPIPARPLLPSYRLELDGAMGELEFRLPCGRDQEQLAAADASAHDLGERLLDACVLSGARPEGTSEALIAAIERNAPSVEIEVELRCPECGHGFDVELDMTSLLLREVAGSRASFEREIHRLAFHYHWPPRELYRLTRPQRQRFLRLIVDELSLRAG